MTKGEWANLDPKQQWDCIVALRGPDCFHPEKIKWVTTSVIRGQMSSIMRVGGLVNEEMKLVILPNNLSISNPLLQQDQPYQYGWCADHFLIHTYEAAINLGIPILLIESELWWKIATKSFAAVLPDLIEVCKEKRFESQLAELEKLTPKYQAKKLKLPLNPPYSLFPTSFIAASNEGMK